ncbi:MAG TPA: phosphoribosylanthranilate isomerase [Thermodesulfobacteriaceae bacterium]|nr:phosphoribosylanthranilate isomerase [Thermodesulfobacteriaceae bacterium]
MVRIKVCGLTDPEEAVRVAQAGVHAVGLVFARSPRKVDRELARNIVSVLPPFIQTVGVFVDQAPEEISAITDYCGLDLIQLHGSETPEVCRSLFPRAVKAWRVRSEEDVDRLIPYEPHVRGFLLDAWSPEARGGTGKTFDWSLAVCAVRKLSKPVMLAGGLNPENIARAVKMVRPWGVDVSSGVEISPGKKNMDKVTKFIEIVHGLK